MTRRTFAWTVTVIAIAIALIAAKQYTKRDDPIAFTATVGEELKIYIENYSDTTLVVNHITVITSSGAVMTLEDIQITNGALWVNAPIVWRNGEEATIMVGCTFGAVNFVRQVTTIM